jgi:hypothetical protein
MHARAVKYPGRREISLPGFSRMLAFVFAMRGGRGRRAREGGLIGPKSIRQMALTNVSGAGGPKSPCGRLYRRSVSGRRRNGAAAPTRVSLVRRLLDSERDIAWRLADSLTLRQFLSIGLDEQTPDHVTISRTRRLIGAETHHRIFSWVLERLAHCKSLI